MMYISPRQKSKLLGRDNSLQNGSETVLKSFGSNLYAAFRRVMGLLLVNLPGQSRLVPLLRQEYNKS